MQKKSWTYKYQSVLALLWLVSLGGVCHASQTDYYQVTDSFGKHYFTEPPKRVVVTDWALLEQMLELGVQPVGAPEVERYQHYVRQPKLPSDIVDIGLRRSPNLQTIRDLKPDIIVLGTDQKSLARPFSHIATVLYYKSFSDKYRTNGKKTRERFLQIADLFQKQALAEQKLADLDRQLNVIRQQIAEHFSHKPPKLTLIRFSSDSKCLVYGANSIADYTLQKLGLVSGASSARSKWGEEEIRIAQLDKIEHGLVLYIKPVNNAQALFSSPLWNSLDIVEQQRVYPMQVAWSYGGAMSVLYTARAIRDALLAIPNNRF